MQEMHSKHSDSVQKKRSDMYTELRVVGLMGTERRVEIKSASVDMRCFEIRPGGITLLVPPTIVRLGLA